MAFLDTLRGLPLEKKLIAGGVVAAMLLGLGLLAQRAAQPSMALLYAGLDGPAAGEIIARLDSEAVTYKIDGQRIYVPVSERDRLRMILARDGLPKQSVTGYELLDDLSGFSTTSDMFSAAYWRAKEGELTRTLLTIPGVTAARVHIGTDDRSLFARAEANRSASVTLTAPGGLTAKQVKAVQHLTALAVAGLKPNDVAVIESTTGLVSQTASEEAAAALDETSRAAALEKAIGQLLEARVGPGNARVSVSVSLTRAREEITEQIVDPDTAVIIDRTINERVEKETGRDRAVTVASDLPDGDTAESQESMEMTETEERVSYAVTTRDRRTETMPGTVERLSIAVLLNHLPAPEGEEESVPRTAEEIAALRELIETAAGVDAARGDRVSIQTLPFQPIAAPEAVEQPNTLQTMIENNLIQIIQTAILGLVVLFLGLFVVRPMMKGSEQSTAIAELTGPGTYTIEDPLTMLRQASAEETDAAAALLNAWLEEEEEAA